MKKITVASIFLLLINLSVSAQEKVPVTFGKVLPADFNLPQNKIIDSNTNAVIIADVGIINFVGNKENNWISYVYKKTTRIKIINSKAFDLTTVHILLRGNGKSGDKVENLEASTFNLENGNVIESKLNMHDVYRDTISKNHTEEKFSFPAIKEGCIVEYTYTVKSRHYWVLPYWSFQHNDYPCLYSKFEAAIPNLLGYLTIRRGENPFVINNTEKSREMFQTASFVVTTEVKKHTWVIKEIPAFKKEYYLQNPYDYLDKIELHLLQTYNGEEVSGSTNWATTNKELLVSNEFGAAITIDGAASISNATEKLTSGDIDYMDAAKHIYFYIRDNFICDSDDDIYLDNELYNVNKKKKGTVEEINLLLVAMLRQKKINASPVILSTTEYGTNPASYPVIGKMNYVICMMKMGGDTVFLDASRPLLGFGKLPIDCYNGHARIISDVDSGSVFFKRDNVKEQKSTTIFIVNDEKTKGLMSGSVEITPGYLESYELRNTIKANGEKDFFKNVREAYGNDVTVENTGIDSLKKLEEPVKIHYDFNYTSDINQDIIYYTPVILPSFKENPLKAEQRKYPIEMPYPLDEIYILNMEIPIGYVVDELPKSSKVAYNGNDGFFEYLIEKNETSVQLRTHIKLNKATFVAEDYNSLREFFAFIVKKQSEQIVFKKKK